jgi:phosphatidylethanolamine N-methyltransferase
MIDIERTYGGAQKPLVARTPLKWETEHGEDGIEDVNGQDDSITPEATDGKFSSVVYRLCKHKAEQTGDTENEAELPRTPTSTTTRKARSASTVSLGGDKAMTMHDLNNRYFRKPAITFWRLDIFRYVYGLQRKASCDFDLDAFKDLALR